jgi:hypothetical protein
MPSPLSLAQRLAPDDMRARFAPDTLANGAPNPDATAGLQQAYGDWQQRGAEMPPAGDWLTSAGKDYMGALLMGSTAPGMRAFHGSPHSFEKFSLDKIGTGEGAQAFGHGLYFAENEGPAKYYRDMLTPPDVGRLLEKHGGDADAALSELVNLRGFRGPHMADYDALKQYRETGVIPRGNMYEVNINADPSHFLHWDKPLSEQSPQVQSLFPIAEDGRAMLPNGERADPATLRGESLYRSLAETRGGDHGAASTALLDAGIPGIRYLDQGSRGAGEGSHNIVAFDPSTIEILRKYGLAGLGLGGAAAATAGAQGGQDTAP